MWVNIDELDSEMTEEGDEIRTYLDVPFTGTAYHEMGGQLVLQCEFRDGFPNGLKQKWYPDGTMQYEASLIYGGAHGQLREWHPNGVLACIARCEYGICLESQEWDENGKLLHSFSLEVNSGMHRELLRRREYYSNLDDSK
jgi:antitoxin component YwqK of YwqJK toxin-antitoxin module